MVPRPFQPVQIRWMPYAFSVWWRKRRVGIALRLICSCGFRIFSARPQPTPTDVYELAQPFYREGSMLVFNRNRMALGSRRTGGLFRYIPRPLGDTVLGRKIAILGRYHMPGALRVHPRVQRRKPKAPIIRNLSPCQPAHQRDTRCILAKFFRFSCTHSSPPLLHMMLTREGNKTRPGPNRHCFKPNSNRPRPVSARMIDPPSARLRNTTQALRLGPDDAVCAH